VRRVRIDDWVIKMSIVSSLPLHHGLVGRTLASDVLHRLRGDIISCVLKPGEKLKFEMLRTVYKASFSTLREALSQLASEGLVEVRGQQGFRVASISTKDLADITDLRVLIECEALRLAIERGDKDWETAVLGAYHRMDRERLKATEPHELSPEWTHYHREFHDTLAMACASPPLLQVRRSLFERSERYRRISAAYRKSTGSNRNEHRDIMEAALERDSVRCIALIGSHIRLTAEFVLAAADQWSAGYALTGARA
jgi:GntR family transcriptional regulator, carbon starvation induced regulator